MMSSQTLKQHYANNLQQGGGQARETVLSRDASNYNSILKTLVLALETVVPYTISKLGFILLRSQNVQDTTSCFFSSTVLLWKISDTKVENDRYTSMLLSHGTLCHSHFIINYFNPRKLPQSTINNTYRKI